MFLRALKTANPELHRGFVDYLAGYPDCMKWRERFQKETHAFYENRENLLALDDFIHHVEDVRFRHEEVDKIPGSQWNTEVWTLQAAICLRWPLEYYASLQSRYETTVGTSRIQLSVDRKLNTHRILSQVRDLSDNLFVCEVGRGLDVLIALTIKAWGSIRGYDFVDLHAATLTDYFKGHNLECLHGDSTTFDFSTISERTILIANEHMIPASGLEQIAQNKNIVCAIINGEILSGPRDS